MHPTASQATEARVERRTLSVSLKELAFCRRFASGTRQLSIVISAFWTTRKAILFSIFSAVKPGVPFFHDKGFDLVVRDISRPHHAQVGEGGVADPLLLPMENPGVALPAGRGQKPARCPRSNERFCQGKTPDLIECGHVREPALSLFFRATDVYGSHS